MLVELLRTANRSVVDEHSLFSVWPWSLSRRVLQLEMFCAFYFIIFFSILKWFFLKILSIHLKFYPPAQRSITLNRSFRSLKCRYGKRKWTLCIELARCRHSWNLKRIPIGYATSSRFKCIKIHRKKWAHAKCYFR